MTDTTPGKPRTSEQIKADDKKYGTTDRRDRSLALIVALAATAGVIAGVLTAVL